MNNSDVIVIGSGFAGLMAALVSAEQKKKVTVLTYGSGTFPLNSGLIDVMGYGVDGKVVESPAAAYDALPSAHPYKKIGQKSLEKAIDFFLDFSKKAGYAYTGSLDKQQWVITAVGTMKPSCLVPVSMRGQVCFDKQEIVLVGVKDLKDYYVDLVENTIKDWVGKDKKYTVVTLDTKITGGRDLTTLDVARWMDSEKGYADCLSQLKPYAGSNTAIVVPQILGTNGDVVYKKLVSDLGCDVVETTGMPPSTNGLRFRDMLLQALRQRGVTVIDNIKVTKAVCEGQTCKAVMAGSEVREREYKADRFILATGGFYSGGITMRDFGETNEVVFGLPVEADCVEERWVNEQLFSSQKQTFAKAGVRTDASLRAVDEAGNCVLENVYVVGRDLSGYDFCFEHSGNGVALSSAYKAAMA